MSTLQAISPQEAKLHVQKLLGIQNFNGTNPRDTLCGAIYPSGRDDLCIIAHKKTTTSGAVLKQLICVYRDHQSGAVRS